MKSTSGPKGPTTAVIHTQALIDLLRAWAICPAISISARSIFFVFDGSNEHSLEREDTGRYSRVTRTSPAAAGNSFAPMGSEGV
jgi:hypothetical protein